MTIVIWIRVYGSPESHEVDTLDQAFGTAEYMIDANTAYPLVIDTGSEMWVRRTIGEVVQDPTDPHGNFSKAQVPYDEVVAELKPPRLETPGARMNHDLVASLIGRTITAAKIYDVNPPRPGEEHGWNEHERFEMTLDDGRTVEVAGWGHDAWGVDVDLKDAPTS